MCTNLNKNRLPPQACIARTIVIQVQVPAAAQALVAAVAVAVALVVAVARVLAAAAAQVPAAAVLRNAPIAMERADV